MIAICKSSTERVFNSSCGNELWALFDLGITLFGLCVWGEELVALSKVEDLARAPRIPSMISICGGSPEGFYNDSCGNYEPFLAWDGPFRDGCA